MSSSQLVEDVRVKKQPSLIKGWAQVSNNRGGRIDPIPKGGIQVHAGFCRLEGINEELRSSSLPECSEDLSVGAPKRGDEEDFLSRVGCVGIGHQGIIAAEYYFRARRGRPFDFFLGWFRGTGAATWASCGAPAGIHPSGGSFSFISNRKREGWQGLSLPNLARASQ